MKTPPSFLTTAVLCLLSLLAAPPASRAAEPKPSGAIILRLDDVHGLWGGHTVVLDADGNVFVRKVRRPDEQRHHLKLPADELAGMLAFIASCGIRDYREHARPGVPDEAHPRITVTLAGQEKITAAKWANDKVPEFDKLYARLLQLAERAVKTPAYLKQPFDSSAKFPAGD